MKRTHVAALLLSMGILGMPAISAEAKDTSNIAFMSCSKGDKMEITLDSKDTSWVSSDKDIAVLRNGVVVIKNEGKCELTNKKSGFKIKVKSDGESKNSKVMTVNYSTSTAEMGSVLVRDKTVGVKKMEVNSTVKANEDSLSSNFTRKEQEQVEEKREKKYGVSATERVMEAEEKIVSDNVDVTANEKGTYVSQEESGESSVIKVVSPTLNQYKYQGSVGQSTKVEITNLDVVPTYSSSDENIATVDAEGNVQLVGGGEAIIKVSTGNNEKECIISSLTPSVNESSMSLSKGHQYRIEVENNFANLPVSYQVVSGSGTVSDIGEVEIEEDTVVRVTIGDKFVYDKAFLLELEGNKFWNEMQPYIEECLGTPYVWGGVTPLEGMDCSGYISYVYGKVGLSNSRETAQGYYDLATPVDRPAPGDLVFFKDTYETDGISHIGIYAGDGMMYHSGEPNQKTSINTKYWQQHLVGYGTMTTDNYKGKTSKVKYSQKELETIWAIVAQESSTDYEGALAVITCAMNRADKNFGDYGTDALSQLTAPGQFCYSPEVSDPELWKSKLGGNVEDFVVTAVNDCLSQGKRNHMYLSFRSDSAPGRTNIGGNWYFNEE